MKSYRITKSSFVFTLLFLLLFASSIFAEFSATGLWSGTPYKQVPGEFGPGLVTRNQGNILFLSSDGSAYEITSLGTLINYGQHTNVVNVVAPPSYIDASKDYLVYVSAQSSHQNRVVVHDVTSGSGGNSYAGNLDAAAYGVVAYASGTYIEIITAVANHAGTVYKFGFQIGGSSVQASGTVNAGHPVKVPPLLSANRQYIYVMTQYGRLVRITNSDSISGSPYTVGTYGDANGLEFTVPLAMDESGYIYALRSDGTLFKIDPSNGSEQHVDFLVTVNSSGPLIDAEGNVFIFGDNGKVVALNSSLNKMGEFSIGQPITSTPGIVKGRDGVTYLIVPSSSVGAGTGKITVLSYNSTTGALTEAWTYTLDSTVPISGAINVAPMGALMEDYYFAVGANNGKVYAWTFNGYGPYGSWPVYGQNSYNTGFVDQNAILFKTKIHLVALESYFGQPISSNLLGNTSYGVLYDATILHPDDTFYASYTNRRTNETNPASILEAVPGSKAVVRFSTPTEVRVLLNKLVNVKGGTPPSNDATFTFIAWKTTDGDNYEGAASDNPATITFRFSNRTVKFYTEATYTFHIYHKYAAVEATATQDASFNYTANSNNPQNAKVTINASPNQSGSVWFPYKWEIWQWDPTQPSKYTKKTKGNQDSVDLPLQGPAYIEIYYAQLNATLTLLVPEFAYGKTLSYLFLDAATDAVVETIQLTTKNGVTIDSIFSESYAPGVTKENSLSTLSATQLTIVTRSFNPPLAGTTRVATVALYLMFPERVQFQGTDSSQYEPYFEPYGYAQIQGQNVEPENLKAKIVYKTNRYLYLVGDFNDDYAVDINDWNMFVTYLGTTVSGDNIKYNIGPRDGFVPPIPLTAYSAGYLTDTSNKVDQLDLYIFASMFGTVVPESDRVQ
ncbi:MAG: hypothetical protein ACUVQF_03705 [Fervidobacterium sp.]|uniref:hypothetical protein n=1 Tax=Fervidobacterium sp. TaxID=1871331 RepID=UPI0040497FCB